MTKSPTDYAVRDISLADYGRKEISIAEIETKSTFAERCHITAIRGQVRLGT